MTFIDTATNAVKHVTYVGRSPHEAFFTPDGSEVWVTVRGEDYVSVLDGKTTGEDADHRPQRPGHDDLLARRQIRLRLLSLHARDRGHHRRRPQDRRQSPQASPFCPNIAATPDGRRSGSR